MRIRNFGTIAIAGAMCALAGPAGAQTPASPSDGVYVAKLVPLNRDITKLETTAEARFTIKGDALAITVDAKGLPPGMMHLQHFHGFKDGDAATCPTAAADANHDGIIDLIETEPISGTTMVPFHDNPAGMEIVRDTYPKAGADGIFHYKQAVSLKALQAGFLKAFGSDQLNLERRVVFIHGVFPATKLPASAASLGTIPAQVTLPIACGKIDRVVRNK